MASQIITYVDGLPTVLLLTVLPICTAADFEAALFLRLGVAGGATPPPRLRLLSGGFPLPRDVPFSAAAHPIIRARLPCALPGGKGGFGANLRAQGRTAKAKRTSDFSHCRDLNGRRLKSVNDEARLRKWLSRDETEKRVAAAAAGMPYEEAAGAAGVSGWLVGVPNWAEGFAGRAEGAWRRPVKTELCRDWAAARAAAGGARGGPHAGCPRGRACGFAHGEGELRGQARLDTAEAKRVAEATTREAGVERCVTARRPARQTPTPLRRARQPPTPLRPAMRFLVCVVCLAHP